MKLSGKMFFFQNVFNGKLNLFISKSKYESQQTELSFMVLFFFKNVFNGKIILSILAFINQNMKAGKHIESL